MKKALFALLIGATLVSCNKEATPTPKRVFSYAMNGNSMYTKAVQSDAVLATISSALPTEIPIVLTSTKTYATKTGTPIELPSGTYKVSGNYNGDMMGREISNDGYMSQTPAIRIYQDALTITDEVTDYSIPASYSCFALACDPTIVEKASVNDKFGKPFDVDFIETENLMLIFVQGTFSSFYVTITLTPKDTEAYKETTFTLSTTAHPSLSLVEHGKWYYLEPTIDGEQPKVLGYDLPSMEQGTL